MYSTTLLPFFLHLLPSIYAPQPHLMSLPTKRNPSSLPTHPSHKHTILSVRPLNIREVSIALQGRRLICTPIHSSHLTHPTCPSTYLQHLPIYRSTHYSPGIDIHDAILHHLYPNNARIRIAHQHFPPNSPTYPRFGCPHTLHPAF